MNSKTHTHSSSSSLTCQFGQNNCVRLNLDLIAQVFHSAAHLFSRTPLQRVDAWCLVSFTQSYTHRYIYTHSLIWFAIAPLLGLIKWFEMSTIDCGHSLFFSSLRPSHVSRPHFAVSDGPSQQLTLEWDKTKRLLFGSGRSFVFWMIFFFPSFLLCLDRELPLFL